MKKIIFTLGFMIALNTVNAQVLFGTTSAGGNNSGGAITKLVTGTNTLTSAFSFDFPDGFAAVYDANPIQATNGKLYGMTSGGGANGYGLIFSYDLATATYANLEHLDSTNGGKPYGSLVQASDGKLYGMTSVGGSSNYGVIFSYDLAANIYTKLMDFDGTNGRNPSGSLIQTSDGKLYGMTSSGGSYNYGVIFSYDLATNIYKKLMDFDGANGRNPSSLIQTSDGKLYGLTSSGGSYNYGVIFSYDPAAADYAKLTDFDFYTNGANPSGTLVQASDGKLYGMTPYGPYGGRGIIFSYDLSTAAITKLKDLDDLNGAHPRGSLIQASDGKLYGMTYEGGSSGKGVIFLYDPVTASYTKLKDFDDTNGAYPLGSLTEFADGKLYGMTWQGGSGNNKGVIFSYDPDNSALLNIHNFGSNNTGNFISGGLMKDKSNKLYGMTTSGGSYGRGTIFSCNPYTAVFTKLKDFDGTNGSNPYGGTMMASDGKLYGMTTEGGGSTAGVIFSYDPATSVYMKLKDFDGINGASPYGNLIQASDGKLYGMTCNGGIIGSGNGVIFSYDASTSVYTKLKDFDYANGANPYGSLMQTSDGKLYGMTQRGGTSNSGVIFSYDPATSVYIKLMDFDGANGSNPYGSLIQASDGKLYGTTRNGGSSNQGVIFSYDPVAATYTKLKDFYKRDGTYPLGSLVQASDGKLYGMTSKGGINDLGVSFSYDPSTSIYKKLRDFNARNGKSPQYTSFIEIPDVPVTVSIADTSVKEGNIATKNMNFIVSLNAPAARKVTVNYEIQNGTAIAGSDYTSTPGTVSFNKGVTQKLIRVLISGDKLAEPDEAFTVLLNSPVNAGIADGVAMGTIINDDKTLLTTLPDSTAKTNAVQNQNYTIKVWPNPANDFIKVQIDGNVEGDITLQLRDMQGKVLKQEKIRPSVKTIIQQMDVSGLPSGVYLFVITGENGSRSTERIVIQN